MAPSSALATLAHRHLIVAALLASAVGGATTSQAQPVANDPVSFAGGRVVLGGDVSASVSPPDRGYFNDTTYGENTLRLFTGGLSASLTLTRHVSILGEWRVENWNQPRALALFARVRPWPSRPIDVQIGRVPPVFGTYARYTYGAENPLIGVPLPYQYLTTIRSDAAPANNASLLAVRGYGYWVKYPVAVGSHYAAGGTPLVAAFSWDEGVQVRVGDRPVQFAVSVTNGVLGAPRVHNSGNQVSARLAVQPIPALRIGVSGASGAFYADVVSNESGTSDEGRQRAAGADLEWSLNHWLLRTEVVASWWRLPRTEAITTSSPLLATSWLAEGRYRLRPDFYLAIRGERVGFSGVTRWPDRPLSESWDAPVGRLEFGGGYYFRRNLVGKITYQQNWRDDYWHTSQGQVAAQVSYWF